MSSLSEWVRLFLNELEDEEAKNLAWGYVEGAFTDEELDELANDFVNRNDIVDYSAADLINGLMEQNMIGIIQVRGKDVWRTRMAETVRLMARLRQWFPSKTWNASPTLVSDFRFQQRRRVYPKRHIEASHLLDQVRELLNPSELEALQTFIATKGAKFRLSDFQLESTIQMFRNLQEEKTKGFIVTAGTGTGKTLAFYLPTLTWIASRVDQIRWIKAIALYPRNELLKDQLADTLNEVLQINASHTMSRPISIGAVFGDTPNNAEQVKLKWSKGFYGYECPYLKCPKCSSEIVWLLKDHERGIERLVCIKQSCRTVIDGLVMPLTRQSMLNNPPDLIFTTTEMMNRYMVDHKYGSLIGIRVTHPPRIVLLDEVHTYTGTHGAQVALLLRRWQHALAGAPLQFTGLSATLRDAGEFMSLLTGVSRTEVTEVDSSIGETEEKGNEYQLVLRGDPAAGTSLLSTSIQAAMLLRRMLDRNVTETDVTAFGSKLFMFTDDLDVTNRLFHTLLDAESRQNNYPYARRLDREPLAALRSHNAPAAPQRMEHGQSWLFAETIGHDLNLSLPVGRTSSQDSGVDTAAEVIVSSPSLEVGFNDKRVGAVIQHKAPRDLAQFLQRKGRAGRDPQMRPWMVTVLSDFGRDRLTYQSYDTLFQPTIDRQALPIQNRYVLRIQATFAFMDWVSYELREQNAQVDSLWYLFAQPYNEGDSYAERSKRKQLKVSQLIRRVLDEPSYRMKMEFYIRQALRITPENMQAILWEPPRSLMLEVLPTIWRRLQSNWGIEGKPTEVKEIFTAQHPLPEFVPSNLFSELSLPEVGIVVPNASRPEEPMDILQALNTFAPGRVSRRFGIVHGGQSHWVAPPSLTPNADGSSLELLVSTFCNAGEYRDLGQFQYYEAGELIDLPVIRPWKLRVTQSPSNIDTKSNARMVWRSQLSPALQSVTPDVTPEELLSYGRRIQVPRGIRWSSLISETQFFTHDMHSAVSVRRFTIGSEASVRRAREQESIDLSIRFGMEPGKPAALGFIQQVDGIRFVLSHIPARVITGLDENKAKMRSFRTMYFQHSVMEDAVLQGEGNSFVLERMAEIYMSALLHTALIEECTLAEACDKIHSNSFASVMNEVMNVVFQVLRRQEEESDIEEEAQLQRTHTKLLTLFERPVVGERLQALASTLWVEEDEGWQSWARLRFVSTLGEALLQACLEMAGSHRNGELLLDIGGGPRKLIEGQWVDSDHEIWITETIEGGSGIIEEIAAGYQRDPRRFFRLVESALGPSDAEIVHAELSRILGEMQSDDTLREQTRLFRLADGYQETRDAISRIKGQLDQLGVLAILPVMNGFFNRILRPGSNPDTDRFMYDLLETWEHEENRLGVEMDVRVFSYVCCADIERSDSLSTALQHIDPRAHSDLNWRYNVIYGMLWPQGSQIRRKSLESYNPYTVAVPTDRELVLDSMILHQRIDYTDPNWREKMRDTLISLGSVQLLVPQDMKSSIGTIILELTSEPLDLGFLHVYPRVEGIIREKDVYAINFEIREALQ